jgi:hypothetical protein
VHGDELNGIEIIRRLLATPAVKRLKGALLAAPMVNVLGVMHKSRYLPDRRDLNDVYARALLPLVQLYLPGKPTINILNQPGGGSITGANKFETAAPDGLTILVSSTSTILNAVFALGIVLVLILTPLLVQSFHDLRDGLIATMLFGALIIAFLVLEPRGLFGLWLRVRNYFKAWPFSY